MAEVMRKYQDSQDPEIQDLVNLADAGDQGAAFKLQQKIANEELGGCKLVVI